jgi:oxygen-dependent protoporphyrinogen oxidase
VDARVAVVGAGIGGLATAHALLEADPRTDVTILETGNRAGGRLATVEVADLEIEAGPDSFVARKPWAVELCDALGIEMVTPRASGASVWTERGLVELPSTALGVPADVDGLARWPGLSRGGRARALADLIRKAEASEGDESLGSLLRRRLGDEATEGLIAPLLAGLFAGDVDRLGVAATFPELARWERTFGSLIRGAKAALRASSDAGPMFLRPTLGVGELPRALARRLGDRVRTGVAVRRVRRAEDGWIVEDASGPAAAADAVVLAVPAFVASRMLEGAPSELAEIPYVSTAVVALVYPDGTDASLPPTSGFVVPHERAPMTAATFVSRKWPEPAFGSRAVLRCFVGAAGSEDVLEADDADIVDAVCRHLAALLPLPERPLASAVVRWPRSMPQYEVGHLERVGAIERALPAGIFVTGNAYRGVGVADTVRSATQVADLVRSYLLETRRTERVP